MYCLDCGSVAPPMKVTPGRFSTELLLWVLFLVPGFIYSLWRLACRRDGCAVCQSAHLVPADSPAARRAGA